MQGSIQTARVESMTLVPVCVGQPQIDLDQAQSEQRIAGIEADAALRRDMLASLDRVKRVPQARVLLTLAGVNNRLWSRPTGMLLNNTTAGCIALVNLLLEQIVNRAAPPVPEISDDTVDTRVTAVRALFNLAHITTNNAWRAANPRIGFGASYTAALQNAVNVANAPQVQAPNQAQQFMPQPAPHRGGRGGMAPRGNRGGQGRGQGYRGNPGGRGRGGRGGQ